MGLIESASNIRDNDNAFIMRQITKKAGCDICPACGGKNVINQISFHNDIVGDGYEYHIFCSDCKKLFKINGVVTNSEKFDIGMKSKDNGEFSYRMLIKMLTDAREQIDKSMHGNESRCVLVVSNATGINDKQ